MQSVQPVHSTWWLIPLYFKLCKVRTMPRGQAVCMETARTSTMLDLAHRKNKWIHTTIHTSIDNLVMLWWAPATLMLLCTACSCSPHNVLHSQITIQLTTVGLAHAHSTMFYIPLVIINHNSTHYCGACSCSLQLSNSSMWLTGTVSQVISIKTILSDDWLNDRVMLQLLGTSGTVENINNIQMKLTLYISLLWSTSSLLNTTQ